MAAYAEDHLMCCPDAKLRETDILDDFRKQTNVEELHFKKAAFYTALEGAIKDKKPGGENLSFLMAFLMAGGLSSEVLVDFDDNVCQ